MVEIAIGAPGGELPIERLPPSALQAIYHAVTGKTESMNKTLKGSVLIRSLDISNLYQRLIDQISQYPLICKPTTTVVVKYENEKSVTYSSWERFVALGTHHSEVTSDVSLKIEAVIRIPETEIDQRIVINFVLDSSLPVICHFKENKNEEIEDFGFFVMLPREWNTVKIKIDFVDFLVARVITGVIEEWFSGLGKTPNGGAASYNIGKSEVTHQLIRQIPTLGMAVFVILLVCLYTPTQITINVGSLGFAISLFMLASLQILSSFVSKSLRKRANRSIIPSVILLTEGDDRSYGEVVSRQPSANGSIWIIAGNITMSLVLNVVACYIYARLSS